MKNVFFILILALFLSAAKSLFANEMQQMNSAVDSQAVIPTTKAVTVGNKICPVSGDKVPDSDKTGAREEAVKYEYNGKIYNLCCKMCVKDFKKNPEKYSKIAEDEVSKEK